MRRIRSRTSGAAILFIVWSLTMAIGAAAAHAAAAQVVEIEFDLQDEILRAPPQTHRLLTQPIQAENVGRRCAMRAVAENNSSVHEGNDLIVMSGESTVTLFDVERGDGAITNGDGLLTLGTTVTIDMRLGPDNLSSGGYRLFAVCEPPPGCETSPALSIGVAPANQDVELGGDASFEVTLTNTGDEDFASVSVDASVDADLDVAACGSNGPLAVGGERSYSCSAEGVDAEFDLILLANATGVDPLCKAADAANAHVAVQPPSCATNPDLTVTVVPMDQEVPVDGDASFQVTVTNSGDEDLEDVAVASSVAACDKDIGALAVGEDFSYSCTAAGVGGDLIVSFDADGRGVSDPEVCEALGSVAATVGNPTTTTMGTTTTTSSIPTRIDTGTGDAPGPAVPVGVLAVFGLGIAALATGAYGVARKER
jgi:hypothetical protein